MPITENDQTKILVLDDYKWIQVILADELAEEGYCVCTCGDGARLMELIEQEAPDLVVMEIGLEKSDGLDLLQLIRNTYYNLPVIIWTAFHSKRHDLRVMAADYFLGKSSDIGELKTKVKMALEGNLNYSASRPLSGQSPVLN